MKTRKQKLIFVGAILLIIVALIFIDHFRCQKAYYEGYEACTVYVVSRNYHLLKNLEAKVEAQGLLDKREEMTGKR